MARHFHTHDMLALDQITGARAVRMKPDRQDDTRLTDPEVRAVLEEAARVELATSVTVNELRQIADEAGYSPETISLAIEHILAQRDKSPETLSNAEPGRGSVRDKLEPSWVRTVCLLGGGALIGELARVSDQYDKPELGSLLAMGVISVSALLIGMEHRHRGTQAGFQLDLAAMWLGFFGGWTIINSGFSEPIVVVSSMMWAATALAGGLIASAYLTFRNANENANENSNE